jgi:hypothetical protein
VSRFKHYILNEASYKKDLQKALKNTNLIVGAEWEFVPKGFEEFAKRSDDIWDEYYDAEEGTEPAIDEVPKNPDERFDYIVDNYLEIDKLPFYPHFKVTRESGDTPTGDTWVIKPDDALDYGIEIASPPMEVDKFMDLAESMMNFVNNYGETTNETGFHVSMSIEGISDLEEDIDPVKLALFFDEEYAYENFECRKDNQWCESVHEKIKKGKITNKIIRNLFKVGKMESNFPYDKFLGINFDNLESNNKYIEFRYMGGKNYHTES